MADYSVADEDKRVVREWNETANDAFFRGGIPVPAMAWCAATSGWTSLPADPCGIIGGYYDPMAGAV